MRSNRAFVKVDVELVQEIGLDSAFLYAFLQNTSQIRQLDNDGYFSVETEYIRKKIGWSKWTIIKCRNNLIECRLLRFRQGVNQNIKNRYKIIK